MLSNDEFLGHIPMEQLLALRERTTVVWCSTSGLKEEEEEEEEEEIELDNCQPDDIAFLQYTSGSTGKYSTFRPTFMCMYVHVPWDSILVSGRVDEFKYIYYSQRMCLSESFF